MYAKHTVRTLTVSGKRMLLLCLDAPMFIYIDY
jgi:hypothetical protein